MVQTTAFSLCGADPFGAHSGTTVPLLGTPYSRSMTTTTAADLPALLHTLRSTWQAQRPSLDQREADLCRLREALKARLDEMATAIAEDFGHRAHVESKLADGMSVLSAIDHLHRHLRRWSKPQRVGAGWRLWPARAQLRPTPLGVVGVISPWNYPVTLALVPLATAIAAGNHVLLKPSEHTPRTSAFLADLLASVFPPDRVAVAQGGADVAAAVSSLPLDHLLFTGSTAVGRKVMAAAAEHQLVRRQRRGVCRAGGAGNGAVRAQVAAAPSINGDWTGRAQRPRSLDQRRALNAVHRIRVQVCYQGGRGNGERRGAGGQRGGDLLRRMESAPGIEVALQDRCGLGVEDLQDICIGRAIALNPERDGSRRGGRCDRLRHRRSGDNRRAHHLIGVDRH